MTIVVICSFAPSVLIFRGDFLMELKRKGYVIAICAPLIDRITALRLEEMGFVWRSIEMESGGMNPIQDVKLICSIRNVISDIRPDIVFSYTIKPVIYGSLAAASLSVPRIFSMITGRGFSFFGRTVKQRIAGTVARFLYRIALRFNQRIIFQNQDDLELFRSCALVAKDQGTAVVNGSGVDLDYFSKRNIINGPPVFLLIARLYREKGVVEFIEAARVIRRKFADVRFRIVGSIANNPSGFSNMEIQGWVEDGIVEHFEWVDDVRPHLYASTVYVLPSYCEGCPRSVLEAMAVGRPIVTTDAPGCRDTVEEGVNGFLVPVRDVDTLAERMLRFVVDPHLAVRMGAESRRIAEERFDVKLVTGQMLEALELGGEML